MSRDVAMVSGTAWYLWNFRRSVITALVADGWTVHAIAGPDDWSAQLAALPGVEVYDWPVSLDGANPVQEFSAFLRLTRLIAGLRPVIVFNNGIKANVYGGLAARLLRKRYVNNISGLGLRIRRQDRMGRVLARLYAIASNRAAALLVQNPDDLAFLQNNGLSSDCLSIRTMGSGVDLAHFAPAPYPAFPPFRALFVGRLQEDKGIHDFIAAARLVKAQNPLISFTVVGSAQHANAGAVPEEMIARWHQEGIAEFAGHQADVRPFLARSHVLVMPSHGGEGMPKVILEAAAMGRAAIVSDIDGCRDCVVPSKTGLLVPPRDPQDLARKILDFHDGFDALYADMSSTARAHAEATFSDTVISQISLDLARGR